MEWKSVCAGGQDVWRHWTGRQFASFRVDLLSIWAYDKKGENKHPVMLWMGLGALLALAVLPVTVSLLPVYMMFVLLAVFYKSSGATEGGEGTVTISPEDQNEALTGEIQTAQYL